MIKKILLTKKYFDKDLTFIEQNLLPECEIITPSGFDEDTLLNYCSEANVFLGSYITKNLLVKAKNLELIQIPWTGVDNFDFNLMQFTQAVVCNSHSNSAAVAEFAVSLFLSLVKNIPSHDRILRNGEWNKPLPDNSNKVSPFSPMISSLTVGIMGFGPVGSKIFRLLKPFGCLINVYTDCQISDQYLKQINIVYIKEELDSFLHNSDVIFICLPLTDETRNLLTEEKLVLLKENSYLVNVARSEIINEFDLFKSCSDNKIFGAALDVWWLSSRSEASKLPSKYNFHKLDNVILSPHRAGMVYDSLPHLDDAITNINNLAQGKPLINVINIQKKY